MTDTNIIELKNVDHDDISDVLVKIERSFGIKFGTDELKDVKTFGELCDVIEGKIQLDIVDDCTSQQAFYKLRSAIETTLRIANVNLDTELTEIFPRDNRRQAIKEVENALGISMKILRSKYWISTFLILIVIVSFIAVFFNWRIGLTGIVFCIIGFKIGDLLGKELDVRTVGELTQKITRENYLKSRRNSTTVNKNEIFDQIQNLFRNDLDLPSTVLTRESPFS